MQKKHEPSKKRVLMLVYSHVKDDPRVRREAHTVVQMGHDVVVFGAARQGGFPTKEVVDGFEILLMPVFTSFGLLPILNMLWQLIRGNLGETTPTVPQTSHKLRSLFTMLFMNLWILRFGLGRRFDLIHTHDIQPIPAAILLKWLYRAKAVHDAHENVDGSFGENFISKLAVKLESYYIARADHVITVGERLKQALIKRGAKQVTVVGNWRRLHGTPIDAGRVSQVRQTYRLDDYTLVISYLGLFFPHRTLPPLLEAVAQSPDVILLIGGRGPLEEVIVEYAEENPNIVMLGWVPMEDVDLYTHLSDVVYYCLDPETSHQAYYVAPNKLFESLIAGKAIIARKGVGEIGEILEDIQSGILLEEVTPQTLQEAFDSLRQPEILQHLQQNALIHREQYTWETAEQRLADIYTACLGLAPKISEKEGADIEINLP